MSAAAVLTLLAWRDPRVVVPTVKDGPGIIALFAYVATFTPAYVRLDAATGALILFASVQITLVVVSFVKGMPFSFADIAGNAIAFAGRVTADPFANTARNFVGAVPLAIGLMAILGNKSIST
jgi:drug/metabolite transporter superfamily protein YnfA